MEQFEQNKYLVVRQLLRNPLRDAVYSYAVKKSLSGSMALGDVQVPGTPSCYGDAFMEMLLELFRPNMEKVTGKRLNPTYSYFRVYKHGDILEAHLDRPSCEISLSLTLGFEAAKPWPILFEVNDQPVPVELLPGDGIVFRGMELKHWREQFGGVRHGSVFLHYVDQNGPCAEWKHDKRNAFRAQARRALAYAGGNILRALTSTALVSR